jgi:AsmA protein
LKKPIKIILSVLVVVAAILLVSLAILVATFNPNAYKPDIVALMQQKYQRRLSIPGEVKMKLFPTLNIETGAISLTEKNSDVPFATLDSARLSLEVMSLMDRRLVVDSVTINGLNVRIKRNQDGSMNIDDLIAGDDKPPQGAFDIDKVKLTGLSLQYEDASAGRKVQLQNALLTTGRLVNGKPTTFDVSGDVAVDKPAVAGKLKLQSGLTFDLTKKNISLSKTTAAFSGDALDLRDVALNVTGGGEFDGGNSALQVKELLVNGSGKRGEQTWQATITSPLAAQDKGQWRGENITVEAHMKSANETLDGAFNMGVASMRDNQWDAEKVSGNGTWQQKQNRVTAKLAMTNATGDAQTIRLQQLQIDADGVLDKQPLKMRANADAKIIELNQIFIESPLKADFSIARADVAVKGTLASPMRIDLAKSQYDFPALTLDLNIAPTGFLKPLLLKTSGPLNLNLARQTVSTNLAGTLNAAKLEAKLGVANFKSPAYTFDVGLSSFNTAWLAGKSAAPAQTNPAKPAPVQDFAWLKALNANGTLRIGELVAGDIRSDNVRIEVKSDGATAAPPAPSVKKKP